MKRPRRYKAYGATVRGGADGGTCHDVPISCGWGARPTCHVCGSLGPEKRSSSRRGKVDRSEEGSCSSSVAWRPLATQPLVYTARPRVGWRGLAAEKAWVARGRRKPPSLTTRLPLADAGLVRYANPPLNESRRESQTPVPDVPRDFAAKCYWGSDSKILLRSSFFSSGIRLDLAKSNPAIASAQYREGPRENQQVHRAKALTEMIRAFLFGLPHAAR